MFSEAESTTTATELAFLTDFIESLTFLSLPDCTIVLAELLAAEDCELVVVLGIWVGNVIPVGNDPSGKLWAKGSSEKKIKPRVSKKVSEFWMGVKKEILVNFLQNRFAKLFFNIIKS